MILLMIFTMNMFKSSIKEYNLIETVAEKYIFF